MPKACFIMGDQLSASISSLAMIDKAKDLVFMCEVRAEAKHIKHHKKKLVLIFSAMRHFAEELIAAGYTVIYVKLEQADNSGSFITELQKFVRQKSISEIFATEPSEYRVMQALKQSQLPLTITADNRFMCSHNQFADWAASRKQLRMEYFYRSMRLWNNILIDNNKPEGGKWNFDQANRQPPPKDTIIPEPFKVMPDQITTAVMQMVTTEFADHFGDIEPFWFAVTRKDAKKALAYFVDNNLANFGKYQDAMLTDEPWMHHSHISFYLNIGLLLPKECIEAAVTAYKQGLAPINSVEGFVRQILGWREYIRGIYWLKMPEYKQENFLNADKVLPDFYWSGDTNMHCLAQSIAQTKKYAYAHHIQRLMVLGNFALIYGVNPSELNEWFWIVYADAFEWVELPNVSGMVLFADGGYLASKPYAAGGSYINKMSDYCKNCHYKVKLKTGPDACPFNYLYWDFLARNKELLSNNQRLAMIYNVYNKMSDQQKIDISNSAKNFYEKI